VFYEVKFIFSEYFNKRNVIFELPSNFRKDKRNRIVMRYGSSRELFVKGYLILCLASFLLVDLSSIFGLLNSATAYIYWSLLAIPLFIYLYRRRDSIINSFRKLSRFNRSERTISILLGLLLAINFFLGIWSPPNNMDGHTYHLTRIIEWVQNGGTDHYPTNFLQQLYHNILGEYIQVMVYLIFPGDRLAFIPQFLAYVVLIFTVSLIGKDLGYTRREQIYLGLITACIPIAVFESTTVQVDLISCSLFTLFVFLGFFRKIKSDTGSLFFCGLSLALSYSCKYTNVFYSIPFLLFLTVDMLRGGGWKNVVKLASVSGAFVLIFFVRFFYRNYQLFGNIIGVGENNGILTERIANYKFTLSGGFSNFMKNLGLHMGLPSKWYNDKVDFFILKIHQFFSIDLNDPAYSMDNYFTRFSVQEDMSPNPIHFWVGLAAILILVFRKVKIDRRIIWLPVLALAGIFVSGLFLRFQFWSSRTQLPFFILLCIPLSYFLFRLKTISRYVVLIPMLAMAFFITVSNPNKPIVNYKYLFKKQLAYVPPVLIERKDLPDLIENSELSEHYIQDTDGLYYLSLEEWENYKARRKVFELLEKSGYYDSEKDNNVFSRSRADQYWRSFSYNYADDLKILFSEKDTYKNLGVILPETFGYYNFWAYLNYELKRGVSIHYVGVFDEQLKRIPTKKKSEFVYKYILTDDIRLATKYIGSANIEHVKSAERLHLITLKKGQNKLYYY
jgi:hypothetical protein